MVIVLTWNLDWPFQIPNFANTFTQKKRLATAYKGDGIQKGTPGVCLGYDLRKNWQL